MQKIPPLLSGARSHRQALAIYTCSLGVFSCMPRNLMGLVSHRGERRKSSTMPSACTRDTLLENLGHDLFSLGRWKQLAFPIRTGNCWFRQTGAPPTDRPLLYNPLAARPCVPLHGVSWPCLRVDEYMSGRQGSGRGYDSEPGAVFPGV